MPLRETRRFKTKGFVISFGDFMLPLVGLVAIGLLLIAGKIFFLSDFQSGSLPIPETVAPPVIPKDTPRADAGEGMNKPSSQIQPAAELPQTPSRSAGSNLVLDLGQNSGTQDNPGVAPNNPSRSSAPQGSSDAGREEIIVVQTPPPAQPQTQKQPEVKPTQASQTQAPPRPALQPRPTQRPVAPKPTESQPAQPEKPSAQPEKPNWMVQVGAFSTPAAAEAVVKRMGQAGHTAVIFSGKSLHRVLVQAGPTKQDALNLATKLGQGEFSGAFVVPPRP